MPIHEVGNRQKNLSSSRRFSLLAISNKMLTCQTVLIASAGLLVLSGLVIGDDPPVEPVEPTDDFDCKLPDPLPSQMDFPNVVTAPYAGSPFGASVVGYATSMEVNMPGADGKSGRSHYVEETVDTVNSKGTIKLMFSGKDEPEMSINYFLDKERKESFSIANFQCVTKNEDDVKDAYKKDTLLATVFTEPTDNWNLEAWDFILGPSAILQMGLLNKDRFSYIGDVGLRGFSKVNVWKGCIKRKDGKTSVIKYHFVDVSMGVGQIPLRVDVATEGEQSFHYIFAYFRQLETAPPVDIPTGYGCLRLDGEKPNSKPELFLDKDYRLELEIVRATADEGVLQSDFSTASVSNAEVVYSAAHNLMSFTQTVANFKKLSSDNPDAFRYQVKKVIDIDEGLFYETNLDRSECLISSFDPNTAKDTATRAANMWDNLPPFKFSDGSTFKILDSDLWFPGDFLHYMGTGSERGFPTVIYESSFDDKFVDSEGEARTVVVTRHSLSNGVAYDSVYMSRGAPIKTVITIYNKERTMFDSVITLNINSFEAGILFDLKKEEVFDITNCFDEPGQSTWFQVTFPAEDLTMIDLAESTSGIENAFRTQLNDIAPSRLPKVLVDFDMNEITVTARLLERPLFTETFAVTDMTALDTKTGDESYDSTIMDTPDNCAKSCQVDEQCTAFSFCDNLECSMFVPNIPDDKPPTVSSVGCTLYERKVKTEANKDMTMNRMINQVILAEIQSQISSHNFKLSVPVTGFDGSITETPIGATDLIKDVHPGWLVAQRWADRIEPDQITRSVSPYSEYQKFSKFLALDNDEKPRKEFTRVVGLGAFSCAAKCTDDPDCQAFSYCSNDEGECIFSTVSGSALTTDMVDTNRFSCTILQKRIIGAFDVYPSFSLDTTAKRSMLVKSPDECARECLEEKSFKCRSFDFCVSDDPNADEGCLMHEFHVVANAVQRRSEKSTPVEMKFNDTSESSCIHFARRFSDDFASTRKSKFTGDVALNFDAKEMTQEMCAHQCSDQAGSACQAFEYCETISPAKKLLRTCRMTNSKSAISRVEAMDDCNVYAKQYTEGDDEDGGGNTGGGDDDDDFVPPVEPDADKECTMPDPLPPQIDFPDVFTTLYSFSRGTPAGYQSGVELNMPAADGKSGYSSYAEETVDTVNLRGVINLQYGDRDKSKASVTYFMDMEGSAESFTVEGYQCKVKNEKNVKKAYDWGDWLAPVFKENTSNWNNDALDEVLGPSVILRLGFLNKNNFKYIGFVPLRGYGKVNVWKGCVKRSDGKNSVLKYYFTDNSAGVGQIPLRVNVETEGEQSYHYVFAFFRQLSSPPDVVVPIGYGCQRLDGKTPKSVPELFLNTDYRMELEIILSSLDKGEKTDFSTASVYSAEVAFSDAHNLFSFTQSELNLNNLENVDRFRYQKKKVIDMDEALVYETDLTTSECSVSYMDMSDVDKDKATRPRNQWDDLPPFEFADKSTFNIMDSDLWFSADGLQYLGTGNERGFPTVIFETTFDDKFKDDNGEMRTVVVTRHFLDESETYDSEYLTKGAPVKTVITTYDQERTKFDRVITLNVHSFQAAILDPLKKEKIFDISGCFEGQGKSSWFQVTFPIDDMTLAQLLESSPAIEKAFRRQLSEIAPSRLPKVLVDYDLDQITVTARLLERPSFTNTYTSKDTMRVKDENRDNSFIVDTPDNCAKSCEVDLACTAFSFCDNLDCTAFVGNDTMSIVTEEMVGCTLYERNLKMAEGSELSLNRMINQVIMYEIQALIDSKSLKLSIPITYLDGTVKDREIGAGELIKDVSLQWLFGKAWNVRQNIEDIMPHIVNYVEYRKDAKFLAEDDNEQPRKEFTRVIGLGPTPCARKCDDDPDCQAFSFCNKDQRECIFSTVSGTAIKTEMIDDARFSCTILQKRMMSTFNQYTSFSMDITARKAVAVSDPDECARNCLDEKEFSCKSFDFCVDADMTASCRMHEFHVAANANQKKLENSRGADVKFNSSTTSCLHYARRYSDDFSAKKRSQFNAATVPNFMSNELSQEMCAHHCVVNVGEACQSFEFCETITDTPKKLQRTCRISSSRTTSSNPDKNDDCSIYSKTALNEQNSLDKSAGGSRFASPGVVAFSAILFITLGAVLGFYVYKHKFANRAVA